MNPTAQNQTTQPNIPISSNPIPTQTNSKFSKKILLILALILVLAGITALTIFLYAQNRKAPTTKQTPTQKETVAPTAAALSTLTTKEIQEKYPNVACERFTNLNEALQAASIACSLDLSGKGLSFLPDDITKLTKLDDINLSNNNFTQFPSQLLSIPTLISINLSKNKLATTPDVSKLTNLQFLTLSENPIPNKATPTPLQGSSATKILQNPSILNITY